MKRNRIRICGRKTSTLPTPAIRPSTSRLLQQAVRQTRRRPARPAQPKPASIRSIGRRGPGEHRLEHHEQQRRAGSPGRRPDAAAPRRSGRCSVSGRSGGRDAWPAGCARPRGGRRADRRRRRLAPGCSPRRQAPRRASSSTWREQVVDAALADGHRGDDRHAELARQALEVDVAGPGAGRCRYMLSASTIGRPTCFSSSTRRSTSRRLVASATQTITSGARLAGQPAQHHVAGDFLVRAAGAQRIGAGQVEHVTRRPAGVVKRALLPLDGDAGVVGDLLAAAGQGVEQRGLAAIGIADQRRRAARIGQRRSFGGWSVRSSTMALASRRRSATRMSSSRTAIGSRPRRPRAAPRSARPRRSRVRAAGVPVRSGGSEELTPCASMACTVPRYPRRAFPSSMAGWRRWRRLPCFGI